MDGDEEERSVDHPQSGKRKRKSALDENFDNLFKRALDAAAATAQIYWEDCKTFHKEEFLSTISFNLEKLRPKELDDSLDTKKFWVKSMNRLLKEYPIPQSQVSPQNFEDNDNNVNKFFGNEFGSFVRKFLNNMGIHYAGTTTIKYLYTIHCQEINLIFLLFENRYTSI